MQGRFRKYASIALSTSAFLFVAHLDAAAQLAREMPPIPSDTSKPTARGPLLPTESNFALDQMRNERVLEARMATRFTIKRLFHERGLRYPAEEIFLRIFKRERSLELWVRPTGSDTFALLKTYPICAMAGELGPKRRQGDNQAPEGFYNVDFFNPTSEFHLSLHVDYPNRHDRVVNGEGANLGGDIYIHGGCSSEGCLALTDEGIKELYWMSVEARAVGQKRIPVHIFPARLTDGEVDQLKRSFQKEPDLLGFWLSLKPAYDFFEANHRVPAMGVDGAGQYKLMGAAVNVSATSSAKPKPIGNPAGGS